MVGRNRYFFRAAAEPSRLGGGLEAWKGFYSSIRPAHRQLMVNVNVCTTAFYIPGNLARAMMDFQNSSSGARMEVFCKSVRIKTTHLGYRKTVKKLVRHTARTYSFDTPEYGRVNVEEYFRRSKFTYDSVRSYFLNIPPLKNTTFDCSTLTCSSSTLVDRRQTTCLQKFAKYFRTNHSVENSRMIIPLQ